MHVWNHHVGDAISYEVVVTGFRLGRNVYLPGLVTHLCGEDGRVLRHRAFHRELRQGVGTHRSSVNSINAFVTSQPRASSQRRSRR